MRGCRAQRRKILLTLASFIFLGILLIIFSSYGVEQLRENRLLKAKPGQKRVIIIHGWKATPEKHWFPWLKQELEKRGFAVAVPQMPNADKPYWKEWVCRIDDTVGETDEKTFLVGHSLGTVAILKYLETLPAGQKIGGVVLAAGFFEPFPNMPRELDNFFAGGKTNYEKISSSAEAFAVISSDNDPFVPLRYGEVLSEKLNAAFLIMPSAGHIRQDEGFVQFPEALRSVVEISRT